MDNDVMSKAMDNIVAEFKQYLGGKRKEGMGRYRPAAPGAPEKEASEMPDECSQGVCEHSEHWHHEDIGE